MKKYFFVSFFVSFLIYILIIPSQIHAKSCTTDCDCGDCEWCSWNVCSGGAPCGGCGGGGCFTGDTEITTDGGKIEIEKVKEGDVVKSFDAQTGEIRDATVSGIHKTQASGYYILKTESGREVKVTGEHPFLAVKQGKWEVSKVSKVSEVSKEIKDWLEKAWQKVKGMVK